MKLAASGCLAASLALTSAACAPSRVSLPTQAGRPLPDTSMLAGALSRCERIRGVSAEMRLSGRVAGQRLRGRVIAGVTADAIRLEGVAPFGAPAFILAAETGVSTLLLPRDDRVLTGAAPAEILGALVGVEASPSQLLVWLTGCPPAQGGDNAQQVGDRWILLRHEEDTTSYFRLLDAWELVAVRASTVTVEYPERAEGQPSRVRLTRTDGESGPAFDLELRLSQVEVNPQWAPRTFQVDVEPGMMPISLEELRSVGPLRDRESARR